MLKLFFVLTFLLSSHQVFALDMNAVGNCNIEINPELETLATKLMETSEQNAYGIPTSAEMMLLTSLVDTLQNKLGEKLESFATCEEMESYYANGQTKIVEIISDLEDFNTNY